MTKVQRKQLEDALVGYQKTYRFLVWIDGERKDLGDYSVVLGGAQPDASIIAPTKTVPTQTGDDLSVVLATFTAAQLATTGEYLLDIRVGSSSGTEEIVTESFKFQCHENETFA